MEYRDVEARLAELHKVDEEGIGAFRARLRVLRDMNIPNMPKVGKGSRVEFSIEHLAELHLAITLSRFGLPPARILQIVEYLRGLPPLFQYHRKTDLWMVLTMRAGASKLSDIKDKESILSITLCATGKLAESLEMAPANEVATWQAVLNMRQFAEDLHSITYDEK